MQPNTMKRNLRWLLTYLVLLSACGRVGRSGLKEAWNPENNPKLLAHDDMVTLFKDLPLKGEVTKTAWSDSYWPTWQGGISYRWLTDEINYELPREDAADQLYKLQSPAEKYDLALERYDFPTVQSERLRTQVLSTIPGTEVFKADFKIPTWEGLCHGWAAAAHNFSEPSRTVTVDLSNGKKVVFYPSDIKALLIYYQQYNGNRSTTTVFAGERCNEDFKKLDERLARGEITVAERDAAKNSPACRDTNAATLHLVLANEIGRRNSGFIIDITRDAEVWNQPVNSFTSEIVSQSDTVSEGDAPDTTSEVRMVTRVVYSSEMQPRRNATGAYQLSARYEYVLELNKDGEIIGGHWISEERPDFLWRESTPIFQGYFKRLSGLYQRSIP